MKNKIYMMLFCLFISFFGNAHAGYSYTAKLLSYQIVQNGEIRFSLDSDRNECSGNRAGQFLIPADTDVFLKKSYLAALMQARARNSSIRVVADDSNYCTGEYHNFTRMIIVD
jgi:hypothetical protein